MTGSQGQVSHCVALNSVDNFLEDTNNDVSDVISSEGCFACQMNKPPKNSRSSSSTSIQQRNRKGKSRSSYTRRSRNYHYSSQRKILKRRTRRNTFHATFTSIRPCKLLLFSNFSCMFLNPSLIFFNLNSNLYNNLSICVRLSVRTLSPPIFMVRFEL